MKVTLDLHDFSIVHNRLAWLMTLKQQFPDFKVSLMTVPLDVPQDFGGYQAKNEYLKEIHKCLDWMQFIPHGLTHNGSEMRATSYETFKDNIIPAIDDAFNQNGIPYVKGFCAPHWRWSEGVVKALDELEWFGIVDRRQPSLQRTKKFYCYSHCLDEDWGTEQELKLHGHVYGTTNDLALNFDKLMKLPKDTQWQFVTDSL